MVFTSHSLKSSELTMLVPLMNATFIDSSSGTVPRAATIYCRRFGREPSSSSLTETVASSANGIKEESKNKFVSAINDGATRLVKANFVA